MIRFIITITFLILFLVVSIPIIFVEWLLQKHNRHAADISSLRIVQWAFKVVIAISGVKLTVLGEENVPKDEAVLYIPNHQSYFDIILTYSRCPDLTGYVAKYSMIHVPLLSNWMKRLYCLFLNRDNIKEGLKTILVGIDQIKHGISMCIFPEGTRNKEPQEMMPFKEGSLKMAEKSGCPIIPIAITNSAEIFENHFPKIKPCHVIIQYGKPIRIQELDKEQKKFLGAYTRDRIQEMLDTHGELL
ncbi:MAG: 1-acyl-sn-glycerol-3-phosphate acyltransferase [Lachnospiraceae bacterium]|jgi:1-acyl-sn-glycerol-3-phosphate acyltransferase|nr:1-acyl-sn-glycerol-3-phosphate acyltransferase [Lachnospiraceae bacterium]